MSGLKIIKPVLSGLKITKPVLPGLKIIKPVLSGLEITKPVLSGLKIIKPALSGLKITIPVLFRSLSCVLRDEERTHQDAGWCQHHTRQTTINIYHLRQKIVFHSKICRQESQILTYLSFFHYLCLSTVPVMVYQIKISLLKTRPVVLAC